MKDQNYMNFQGYKGATQGNGQRQKMKRKVTEITRESGTVVSEVVNQVTCSTGQRRVKWERSEYQLEWDK